MRGMLDTAGERIRFDVAIGWIADLIEESAGSTLAPDGGGTVRDATMEIVVERDRRPFRGGTTAGRGVRVSGNDVVIENAAQSGFDWLIRTGVSPAQFVMRWRPRPEIRALRASPARWRLRLGAALTQHPALWRATTAARTPLHAACVRIEQGTALVVGTPGAGKSTVLAAEMAAGGAAVGDNLCVADPQTVWGVAEPFRIDPAFVPEDAIALPATHGRVSIASETRIPSARPDVVVVLSRGAATDVADQDPSRTARLLVTSTYACGELRRFWPLAATLAMTTGLGPALPPVLPVARALVDRLPCVGVTLARPGVRLSEALAGFRRRNAPAAEPVVVTR